MSFEAGCKTSNTNWYLYCHIGNQNKIKLIAMEESKMCKVPEAKFDHFGEGCFSIYQQKIFIKQI